MTWFTRGQLIRIEPQNFDCVNLLRHASLKKISQLEFNFFGAKEHHILIERWSEDGFDKALA